MSQESLESKANTGTTARRRLVRGVFAAPAVLTLYSGSVAATSVSCVARQQDPTRVIGNPGTAWVRVPEWSIIVNGNKSSWWVRGQDLAALQATSSYLASTSWQLIRREDNSPFTPVGKVETSTPTQALNANDSISPSVTTTYVAVRIDSTGAIIGVEPIVTSTGSAISTSCWTSFGGVVI